MYTDNPNSAHPYLGSACVSLRKDMGDVAGVRGTLLPTAGLQAGPLNSAPLNTQGRKHYETRSEEGLELRKDKERGESNHLKFIAFPAKELCGGSISSSRR